MSTLAVLPIKSFDAAKQRLAATLGAGSRQALARSMFSDVLASLRHVPGLDAIVVVAGDREAESASTGDTVGVIRDRAQAGQSSAARLGIEYALDHGYERVLLVPGDTPLLDAGEVRAMLSRAAAERRPVTIVPDRHGEGTNALLLSPPDAIDPAFGPGSLERHVNAAEAAGLAYTVEALPSLVHDVDTPDDLAELGRQLESRHGLAPMTRGTLRQIERLHGPAPVAPAPIEPPVNA
jgi:2-phospho-L-lactate guanylyltransferase